MYFIDWVSTKNVSNRNKSPLGVNNGIGRENDPELLMDDHLGEEEENVFSPKPKVSPQGSWFVSGDF